MTLIKSISGIRGTIGGFLGEGLSPLDVVKYTAAYTQCVKDQNPEQCITIVVGRDARISGPMVQSLIRTRVLSGLFLLQKQIFMQQTNPPDAIMAATDFMAIGVLKYLNEQGISVPETVAVVGFDNLERSAETTPPLTTIKLPLEQLATNSIEALIHQIENDKTIVKQVFDCKFIVRQSS